MTASMKLQALRMANRRRLAIPRVIGVVSLALGRELGPADLLTAVQTSEMVHKAVQLSKRLNAEAALSAATCNGKEFHRPWGSLIEYRKPVQPGSDWARFDEFLQRAQASRDGAALIVDFEGDYFAVLVPGPSIAEVLSRLADRDVLVVGSESRWLISREVYRGEHVVLEMAIDE